LKSSIKVWSKESKKSSHVNKSKIKSNLSDIDKTLDQGGHNDEVLILRSSLLKDLNNLDSIEVAEIAQKAKIRWAIEGDEKSRYFHGILNSKHSQLAIRGILNDGDWIDDPCMVKNNFLEHFSNRFSKPDSSWLKLDFIFPNQLTSMQSEDLERPVTYDEIKTAIWECGTNKSPGPDGFTFEFFRNFWSIVNEDVVAVVRDFFYSEWDESNIKTLVHVLKYFFLASGLKMNLQKSKLMGIGINKKEVDKDARLVCCSAFSTPFNYLGVKVADVMSKVKSWDEVTLKLSGSLSKWKLNTLLIGGRLTLIKYVLTLIPLYYMSIFKVPVGVLNKLESIRRNFFNGVDGLVRKMTWIGWNKFITAIHGVNSALDVTNLPVRRIYALELDKNVSVADKKKALDLSFRRTPRGGVEEEQFKALHSCITDLLLLQTRDRWVWSLNSSGEFLVKSVRNYIDDILIPKVSVPTRWVKVMPIKVNIFAWRVWLDNLPTQYNLSSKGLEIPSIICPICNIAAETTSHLFFSCELARQVWNKVLGWWNFDPSNLHSYDDWLTWFKSTRLTKSLKDILKGVCYVMWRVLWSFRNNLLFAKVSPNRCHIFDDIVRLSYT
ncbi:RNA-directed DNA polymerase, eukaryota, partial [Tanacetum coccineum]